ncbi:outer membrane protein assembly factor BamB family protein [Phytohabitans sp. LJ34]|uniref:outer membrane protein assembly factor BamB family protein n=1 Tax=Phytohabitans sp. LJ34 TaxID=3452217 RepID=UPI003F8BD51B
MTTDGGAWPQTAAPGTSVSPLWVAELPGPGGGGLIALPSGGCVVSMPESLLAFTAGGEQMWRASAPRRHYSEGRAMVVAPEGALIRMENGTVVTRELRTGEAYATFPAPRGQLPSLTPWGDLAYWVIVPGQATLHCVTRAGQPRWSVDFHDRAIGTHEPLPVGDVIVVDRNGVLWAFDRDGQVRWLADPAGVRAPSPDDWTPRPAGSGYEMSARPMRLDRDRALVELQSYTQHGIYLLDGASPGITPVAVPTPARAPFVLLPAPPGVHRMAGLGGQVQVGPMKLEYQVVAFESGEGCVWEHRMPAEAAALEPAPDGGVVAMAQPSSTVWRDYRQWYDMSDQTLVRSIDPEGRTRWSWHAHTPITHGPLVTPDGLVYVGCAERLWAFPVVAKERGE